MKTFDIVYPLIKSNWNHELKYSLRSFEKFFPQMGKVWIVGYLPPYINPNTVNHVPTREKIPGVYLPSVNATYVNNELEGLSERYIWANDDHYLLRPLDIEDFGPYGVQDLAALRSRGTRPWQLMLWRTYDILTHLGYPGMNYESHTPTYFDRKKFSKIAKKFQHTEKAAFSSYESYCIITAYWNIVGPNHVRNANDYRIGFARAHTRTVAEIEGLLNGKSFFFHDDAGLSQNLKTVINKLYPTKSKFEL